MQGGDDDPPEPLKVIQWRITSTIEEGLHLLGLYEQCFGEYIFAIFQWDPAMFVTFEKVARKALQVAINKRNTAEVTKILRDHLGLQI